MKFTVLFLLLFTIASFISIPFVVHTNIVVAITVLSAILTAVSITYLPNEEKSF